MRKTPENIELVKSKARVVYNEDDKRYNAYFGEKEYPTCGFGESKEEALNNLCLLVLR
jgi:hypothetical protein